MDAIIRGKNIFYIGADVKNVSAKITFVDRGEDKLVIKHTFVSEPFRGQGLGLQLVKEVVEYARQENKKIIPKCPFARDVMTQNDDYLDVMVQP
jgi:predicted GNAT family acetyltransferase